MKFSGAISVILLSCAVVTSNAQQDKSRFLRKQEEAGSILEKVSGEEVVRYLVDEEAEESEEAVEDESEADAEDESEADAEDESEADAEDESEADAEEESEAEAEAEDEPEEEVTEAEEEEDTNAYGSWSNSRWESYQEQQKGDRNNNDGQQHATSWSSSAHYSRNVAAAAAMTVAGVFLANRLKVKCSSCKRASRNISLIEDDTSNTAAYTLA